MACLACPRISSSTRVMSILEADDFLARSSMRDKFLTVLDAPLDETTADGINVGIAVEAAGLESCVSKMP